MKKFLFAIFLLVSPALHVQLVESATLHAFLIGDTPDEEIGLTIARDLKKVSKMLDQVVDHTSLDLNKMYYDGSSARATAFLRLRTLDVGSDDVVFFFISSHKRSSKI